MVAVSSFSSDLLQLYLAAAKAEVVLELGDRKRAIHLRHRMHALRVAMRRENHAMTTIANGVQLTINFNGDLIAYPADGSFTDIIREAIGNQDIPIIEDKLDLEPNDDGLDNALKNILGNDDE